MTTEDLGDTLEPSDELTTPPVAAAFDLRPPPVRAAFVLRRDLMDALARTDADVITLIAPTGYGKTTTLAQWASLQSAPVAWLSMRRLDNDPKTLLSRLAISMRQAGVLTSEDVAHFQFMGQSDAATIGAEHFARLLETTDTPPLMVLDNADLIRSRAANAVLRDLVTELEGRARIALASHSTPKIRLPLVRAHGRLLELTELQLAMSPGEIEELVSHLGLNPTMVAGDIMSATEGWPVAVFLVAIAVRDGALDLDEVRIGGYQHLNDFVRSEIVPHLSKRRREFLKLVSPLERMNGPLCDALAASEDSHRLLESLETETHLVHHMDHDRVWFAMNRVLRDAMLAVLAHEDPNALRATHAKAAAWFQSQNLPLDAIWHAQRAGNAEAFAELMGSLIKNRYARGHVAEVLQWMDWLQANTRLEEHPGLAAIGALVHMQQGDAFEAERWLELAQAGPENTDTDAVVWLVRALAARSGVEQMHRDIETALEAAGPGSRWLPAILATKGLAHVMTGDTDLAEPCFAEAAQLGMENGSLSSVALALGQRALLAHERRDWDLASSLADQAVAIVGEHGLDGYYTSGLALIAAARSSRRRNDIEGTKTLLARAMSMRTRLGTAIPGQSLQILIEMIRAYVELSDVVGARALIREAEEILIQRPDLGVLSAELESLKESLANLGPGTVGLPALTKAELRLLPLLATHMSFPEIGGQLFISRHTVKSQATSIYRKLGASSRSEAMAKAYEIGLLTR